MPRTFDARPDRLDLRDLPYRAPLRSLPPRSPSDSDVERYIPRYVAKGLILNQGTEGACTGFGLACVANYLFWIRHQQLERVRGDFVPTSPRMFYELARRYDEWPGTDYEGSSCRGALKGWHKHGVCAEKLWPYPLDRHGKPLFKSPDAKWEADAATRPLGVYYRIARESIVDMQAAIADIGAIYVSGSAHDGWDKLSQQQPLSAPTQHAGLPEIEPCTDRGSRGGHAFALVGYNERGFVVQNSWGTSWGASGFAVLPYDDWVVNGTDAWALALGVPTVVRTQGQPRAIISSRWRMPSGSSLTSLDRQSRQPGNPADDPWPVDHPFEHRDYQPWSTGAAYEHTLVTGNDGEVVQTDFTRDPADRDGLVKAVVRGAPAMWIAGRGEKVLKLALYAHGGLNDEQESIRRIRVLGPCFEANGIYPLFLTWKTGAGETIADMVQDWARRNLGDEAARSKGILDALGEAKDRALEAAAHVLVKGIWTEMRENAEASMQSGRGLALLLKHLAGLATELAAGNRQLELHLVGHSAGSILLGHFLQLALAAAGVAPAVKVKTCTLFAAACSSSFANARYVEAGRQGVLDLSALHLYVLRDEQEKADALPAPALPAYGKSLLYLVSRALDDVRKQPLLGLERALLPEFKADADQWAQAELGAVQAWQKAWPGSAKGLLHRVPTPFVTVTRQGAQVQATHGSFDNNIAVLTETLERIRGGKLVANLEWLDY